MTRHPALPLSGTLAWWATAWLDGLVGPDDVIDALPQTHAAHVVVGSVDGLISHLASARETAAVGFAAVFPEPGDIGGLGGPPEFTSAALEAGEAILTVGPFVDAGLGLVPHEVGRAIEWTRFSAQRRVPPDLGDADRALRATVLRAANELARLEVARWNPQVADALIDLAALRDGSPLDAPPGIPERAVTLASRAIVILDIAEFALTDDGAAVSAAEMHARRDAVAALAKTARHALAAACSPDAWPPQS